MSWQPIETAPKDGTTLLLSMGGVIPFVGSYDDDDGWHSWNLFYEKIMLPHTGRPFRPSHWMPLPQQPESTE